MHPIDTGFVFALRQEAVGILDRLKSARTTRGNGWTFHTGKIDNISIAVVLSGIGQKKAENAANVLIDVFSPKMICSAGYAGGLSTRLKQSSLCVPEQVMRASDMQVLDLTNPIPKKNSPMPDKFTLLTVNDVVESSRQKQQLHEQTGAELVDMETFAVADVCRNREIPFFSLRVILDAACDQIPSDITKILDNLGKGMARRYGTILGGIWSRPSAVLDLVSLRHRAFTAAERLAKFAVTELSRRQGVVEREEKMFLEHTK